MKTDDFISLLATAAPAVDPHAALKRFALALLAGTTGAVLLMALVFGVRPDIAQAAGTPIFWVRLLLPLSLAAGALWMVDRLARPGRPVGRAGPAAASPVLLLWAAAAVVLAVTPPGERLALVLGDTWRSCTWNIALLSLPALGAVLWALRGMAPSRPGWAGAAGGLLAGAVAASAYCLHCPELAVPFWAVWYVLGMLIPAGVGALLGPRLLRW